MSLSRKTYKSLGLTSCWYASQKVNRQQHTMSPVEALLEPPLQCQPVPPCSHTLLMCFSLNVSIHTSTHAHIHTDTRTHTHTHMCTHTHADTCTHAHTHRHMHTHTQMHTHTHTHRVIWVQLNLGYFYLTELTFILLVWEFKF